MKIILKNFRCFADKTFILPNSGLILLQGNSGAGKSTLINSILFALYGTGKKVTRKGTKSCSVTIEYKYKDANDKDINFIITRTKGPIRLTINIDNTRILEDDSAQAYIDSKFGRFFNVIQQKSTNSFLTIQPIERMKVLEELLLKDYDVRALKEKVKEFIATKKKSIDVTKGEINTLERLNPKFICNKPNELIPPNQFEQYQSNINKLISDYQVSMDEIEQLKQQSHNIENIRHQLATLEKLSIDFICESTPTEIVDNIDAYKQVLDEQINTYNNFLQKLETFEEKQKEQENLVHKLGTLNTTRYSLAPNFTHTKQLTADELKELEQNLNEYKKYYTYIQPIEQYDPKSIKLNLAFKLQQQNKEHTRLSNEIATMMKNNDEYEKRVDIKNEYDSLCKQNLSLPAKNCPKCFTKLIELDDKLVECSSDHNTNNQIEQDSSKIKEIYKRKIYLEQTLKDKTNDQRPIDYAQLYRLQNELRKTPYIHSPLESLMISDNEFDNIDLSINELQEIHNTLTKYNDKYWQARQYLISCCIKFDIIEFPPSDSFMINQHTSLKFQNEIDKLDQQINTLTSELHALQQTFDPNEMNIIEEEIDTLDKNITLCERIYQENKKYIKWIEYKQTMDKLKVELESMNDIPRRLKECIEASNVTKHIIECSKQSLEDNKKYNEWLEHKALIDKSTKDYKTYEQELLSTMNYSKMITEAESITLNKILEYINITTNDILHEFGMNIQFTLAMLNHKIDLDVMMPSGTEDIESLSGGEFDRLNLALTIALNSLDTTNPICMYDESIASLDEENCGIVLSVLRNRTATQSKLVLVVLHQGSMESKFDEIINVSV
jgi:exonuclease SbcC